MEEVGEESNNAPKKRKFEEADSSAMPPLEAAAVEAAPAKPAPVPRSGNCEVYSAYPPNWVIDPDWKMPEKFARTWPFELDKFQLESVKFLERRENVLVAAHTSAGKTVVAEYAISLALAQNSRVIYTSPIKALSNQKYRELQEHYTEVGLMTGDVIMNPHASCIVMTTEILRNMIQRGSEIMQSVAYIIFDEVHYMRDLERGVVWEESIILLNKAINLVFLSATLSNANEFADWICGLKEKPCHVITTDYRPTPLCHYIFTPNGQGLYLVVDQKNKFHQENFEEASKSISFEGRARGPLKGPSDLARLLTLARERDWLPLIVFSFSRREVEGRALQVAKQDFNTKAEKLLVSQIFDSAMNVLIAEDRELPQIKSCLPLLLRGIGVHHSGLLPILKEVVEILFQEGLIKVLFATETFAMGVNMPAKTVVFAGLQKFDGKVFRHISSGEYTQMSGRAGRRGTDAQGICVLMVEEDLTMEACQTMIQGASDPLVSRFRLTYNMILNLMRVESVVDSEYVISRSLHEYQHNRNKPNFDSELKQLDLALASSDFQVKDEAEIARFFEMRKLLTGLKDQVRAQLADPKIFLPFMTPGRLVYVKDPIEGDFGWGVVVNFRKQFAPQEYVIDVLLPLKEIKKIGTLEMPVPMTPDNLAYLEQNNGFILDAPVPWLHVTGPRARGSDVTNEPAVAFVGITPKMIYDISSVRLYSGLTPDLKPTWAKKHVINNMYEVRKHFVSGEFPSLTPAELGLKVDEVCAARIQSLEERLNFSALHTMPAAKRNAYFELYQRKQLMKVKLEELKQVETQSHLLMFRAELKKRMRVLRRLGHVSAEGVMLQKGTVAAEVESVDELLITELIFEGLFNELEPAACCALLTCLFPMEKTKMPIAVREEFLPAIEKLKQAARHVATVQVECKLEGIEVEEYVESFPTTLFTITYDWCKGKSFPEVTAKTEMFEGSIIRLLRRLEELMRELSTAAGTIGNSELQDKFEAGRKLLKRGIVFAGSLYL